MTIYLKNGSSVDPTETTEVVGNPAVAKQRMKDFVKQFKDASAAARAQFQADKNAILEEWNDTWEDTGTTYTGTTEPETPPKEYPPGEQTLDRCGVEAQFDLDMYNGGMRLSAYLRSAAWRFSKEIEYRWVQLVAPVPPGSWRTRPAGSYDPSDAGNILPTIQSAIAGISGPDRDSLITNVDAALAPLLRTEYFYTEIPGYKTGYLILSWWGVNSYNQILANFDYRFYEGTVGPVHWAKVVVNLLCGEIYQDNVGEGQWKFQIKKKSIGLFPLSGTPETCIAHTLNIQITPAQNRGSPKPPKVPRPNPGGGGPRPPYPPKRWPPFPPEGPSGGGSDKTNNLVVVRSVCTTKIIQAPNIFDIGLTQADLPEGYTLEGKYVEPITTEFTIPGGQVTTEVGNSFLGYNTAVGGLVWDIQLKKWGKFKGKHQFLMDQNAANIPAYNQLNYSDLGITGGPWNNGTMYLWDDQPSEGFIKYGKLGYYRLGFIHFLEARFDFRRPANATITIESSLDGRTVDPSYNLIATAFQVNTLTMFPNIRYKWYNLKIEGQWDLQYMEVRANISARR